MTVEDDYKDNNSPQRTIDFFVKVMEELLSNEPVMPAYFLCFYHLNSVMTIIHFSCHISPSNEAITAQNKCGRYCSLAPLLYKVAYSWKSILV